MPASTGDPGTLHIIVRLHSILRHQDGKIVDRLEMELPQGSRVRDVLDMLKVADELEAVVALNDEVTDANAILSDGDHLAIIPAVAGG